MIAGTVLSFSCLDIVDRAEVGDAESNFVHICSEISLMWGKVWLESGPPKKDEVWGSSGPTFGLSARRRGRPYSEKQLRMCG